MKIDFSKYQISENDIKNTKPSQDSLLLEKIFKESYDNDSEDPVKNFVKAEGEKLEILARIISRPFSNTSVCIYGEKLLISDNKNESSLELKRSLSVLHNFLKDVEKSEEKINNIIEREFLYKVKNDRNPAKSFQLMFDIKSFLQETNKLSEFPAWKRIISLIKTDEFEIVDFSSYECSTFGNHNCKTCGECKFNSKIENLKKLHQQCPLFKQVNRIENHTCSFFFVPTKNRDRDCDCLKCKKFDSSVSKIHVFVSRSGDDYEKYSGLIISSSKFSPPKEESKFKQKNKLLIEWCNSLNTPLKNLFLECHENFINSISNKLTNEQVYEKCDDNEIKKFLEEIRNQNLFEHNTSAHRNAIDGSQQKKLKKKLSKFFTSKSTVNLKTVINEVSPLVLEFEESDKICNLDLLSIIIGFPVSIESNQDIKISVYENNKLFQVKSFFSGLQAIIHFNRSKKQKEKLKIINEEIKKFDDNIIKPKLKEHSITKKSNYHYTDKINSLRKLFIDLECKNFNSMFFQSLLFQKEIIDEYLLLIVRKFLFYEIICHIISNGKRHLKWKLIVEKISSSKYIISETQKLEQKSSELAIKPLTDYFDSNWKIFEYEQFIIQEDIRIVTLFNRLGKGTLMNELIKFNELINDFFKQGNTNNSNDTKKALIFFDHFKKSFEFCPFEFAILTEKFVEELQRSDLLTREQQTIRIFEQEIL